MREALFLLTSATPMSCPNLFDPEMSLPITPASFQEKTDLSTDIHLTLASLAVEEQILISTCYQQNYIK